MSKKLLLTSLFLLIFFPLSWAFPYYSDYEIAQPPMILSLNGTGIGNLLVAKENGAYMVVSNLPNISQSQGYIVEFKDDPLIVYENKLKKSIEEKKEKLERASPIYRYTVGAIQSYLIAQEERAIPRKVAEHKQKILQTHALLRQQLGRISPITGRAVSGSSPTTSDFYLTFNGMFLNVSEDVAKNIEKLDYVKAVYPNNRVEALLHDSLPLIGATEVWSLTDLYGRHITGKNITIAIIDTGVDYTHPDLGNCTTEQFLAHQCSKVIDGWDFVNNDPDPMDDNGHGTHCAGIAAGKGDYNHNNIYEPKLGEVWGVAPDAKIIAYKVLNARGSGKWNDVIAAIERAVDPNQDGNTSDHVDIISMSLGGSGNPDDPVSQAVDNAVDAGVIVVVSAGNSGPLPETISSPGCARKAITVGAEGKISFSLLRFSSRGPVIWYRESLIKPDILAPGGSILSSVPGGRHAKKSGTSMATPHVAGVAALILQKHPNYSPQQVKNSLMFGSKLSDFNPVKFGIGSLSATSAIDYNASVYVIPESISLGTVSFENKEWKKIVNLTIFNTLDTSVNYSVDSYLSISYSPTLDGIQFVYPRHIFIDSNSNISFSFGVIIDNSILPDGEYYGFLTLNSSINRISIPFWFIKQHLQFFERDNVTNGNNEIWLKSFAKLDFLNLSMGSTSLNISSLSSRIFYSKVNTKKEGKQLVYGIGRDILGSIIKGNTSFEVDTTSPDIGLIIQPNGNIIDFRIRSNEDISPSTEERCIFDKKYNKREVIFVDPKIIIMNETPYIFFMEENVSTGWLRNFRLKYKYYSDNDFSENFPLVDLDEYLNMLAEKTKRYIGYQIFSWSYNLLKDGDRIYIVLPYESNNEVCGVSGIRLIILNESLDKLLSKDIYLNDICLNDSEICASPSTISANKDKWCSWRFFSLFRINDLKRPSKHIYSIKSIMDKNGNIQIFFTEPVNEIKILNFKGDITYPDFTTIHYSKSINISIPELGIFLIKVDKNGNIINNKKLVFPVNDSSWFTPYMVKKDKNGNIYLFLKNIDVIHKTNKIIFSESQSYVAIFNTSIEKWKMIKISDYEKDLHADFDSQNRLHLTFSNETKEKHGQIYYGIFNFSSNRTDIIRMIKPPSFWRAHRNSIHVDINDNVNIVFQDNVSMYSVLKISRFNRNLGIWSDKVLNRKLFELSKFLNPYYTITFPKPGELKHDEKNNLYAVWQDEPSFMRKGSYIYNTVCLKEFRNSPYIKIISPDRKATMLNVSQQGNEWISTFTCRKGGTHIVEVKASDKAGNVNEKRTWFKCNMTVPEGNKKPPAPTWIFPPRFSSINTTTPMLKWQSVVDPDGDSLTYILTLDDDANFSSPLVLDILNSTKRQIHISDGLKWNKTYYFKVFANDGFQDGYETIGKFTIGKSAGHCSFPSSPSCPTGACSCNIENCNEGWLRVKLPSGREITHYFENGEVTFLTDNVKGSASGFVSCLDDGKEYNVQIEIK